MDCTPEAVIPLAQCTRCLDGMQDEVMIYLLCAWANGGADPADQGFLLNSQGGYILLSDGGKIIVQT